MTMELQLCHNFGSKKINLLGQKKNANHFIKQRLVPNKYDFEYLSIKKKMCKDLGNIIIYNNTKEYIGIITIAYYVNKIFLYFSDDYFQAKVRAKKSENTSNVSSSSYETDDKIRTRLKKATKKEFNKMEKNQNNKAIKKPAWSPDSIKSLGNCEKYKYYIYLPIRIVGIYLNYSLILRLMWGNRRE